MARNKIPDCGTCHALRTPFCKVCPANKVAMSSLVKSKLSNGRGQAIEQRIIDLELPEYEKARENE